MHKIYQILSITFALMLLASCLPNSQQVPAGTGQTEAAYTMAAVLTESVFQTVQAKLTEVSQPTGTPVPQESSSPAAGTTAPIITTPMPNGAAPTLASNGSQPQPSAQPLSAVTGTLCNEIGTVVDVSIPDGTAIKPGATFTKIWRLKNNGTCPWTTSYAMVQANGVDLTVTGLKAIPLPKEVKPGDTVDMSVLMQAPSKTGVYISYWELQDASGNVFGAGPKGRNVFWVKIDSGGSAAAVGAPLNVYSLADSACYASWFTSKGAINCPGTIDATKGSVTVQSSVKMENQTTRSESSIVMVPSPGGVISGQFPDILVNKDDFFSATIGCLNGHPNCNITFTLGYKTSDGQSGTFGSWTHTMDGNSEDLNLDMTKLAGRNASLILTINANNSSPDNVGYWISPRVWH
jgi:Ig-like domain from next to BRCA1 gene